MSIATGTAEVGGWTTRELLSVLDGLEGLDVIGADVGMYILMTSESPERSVIADIVYPAQLKWLLYTITQGKPPFWLQQKLCTLLSH
jgi:hypothetical protein